MYNKLAALLLGFMIATWTLVGADDPATHLTQELKTKIDTITQILENKTLQREQQDKQVIQTMGDMFDFTLMAQLSLGKEGWVKMNEEERGEFISLFVKRLEKSYLEKIHMYDGEKVKIDPGQQTKGNRIQISSEIVGKGDPIEVVYKFYATKEKQWKIYDLEIAGVSIVQTYRAQFAEMMQSGTPQNLLEKLRTTQL